MGPLPCRETLATLLSVDEQTLQFTQPDFSDDDSLECESDLEWEDEDVVAEVLFHDVGDGKSVSSGGERQADAESAAPSEKPHSTQLSKLFLIPQKNSWFDNVSVAPSLFLIPQNPLIH